MTRRRKGPGGARKGAGRKPIDGVARSEVKTIKLTPDRLADQLRAAAAAGQTWTEWATEALDLALAREPR